MDVQVIPGGYTTPINQNIQAMRLKKDNLHINPKQKTNKNTGTKIFENI